MKLGLPKTRNKLLERLENGDEFLVNKLSTGAVIRVTYIKKGTEPHVCDFLKAGVDKETIAYYFAYLVASGYEVYSKITGEIFNALEHPTILDEFRISKIEKNVMPKVYSCKKERLRAEKQEKEANKELVK